MNQTITRRSIVAGGASLAVLGGSRPARAQAKIKLRFSSAFTEADLRAQAYKEFAAAITDDFDFERYWATRCSSRVPSWSRCSVTILTSAISRRPTSQSRFRPGR